MPTDISTLPGAAPAQPSPTPITAPAANVAALGALTAGAPAVTYAAPAAAAAGVTAAPTVVGQRAGYAYIPNPIAAAGTGGADQLNLNGVAEPSAMANVVQPDVPRNVRITVTDGDASISAFQIDVTGVAPDGSAVSEQFLFAGGLIQVGSKVFASITAFTLTSIAGNAAGDTLDVGYGDKIGLVLPAGSTGLSIVKVKVDGVAEAAAATDATNNSFTPTTVANGARDYEVYFEYLDPNDVQLIARINNVITDLATRRTEINAQRTAILAIAADNVATLAELAKVVTDLGTLRTKINAEIAALKAASIQASV